MDTEKIISVIIPTYNCGRFIGEAIESIFRQSTTVHDIIVVDDGSTDHTSSVVSRFGDNVRYVYQKKSGVAAARNKGLELSKGGFITFLDADDIWVNNKTELQLDRFKKNADTEMVIGFLQRVYKDSTSKSFKVFDDDYSGIFVLQLGCTLIRKEVFRKVGFFDEEMRLSEDLDWFLRSREAKIKVDVHEEVVQLYRQHDNNTTKNIVASNQYMLKAFKKSLDRRRQAGTPIFKVPNSHGDINEILNFWTYKN